MSAPPPNHPQNLFGNTTNNHTSTTNPLTTDNDVEPLPIGVDRTAPAPLAQSDETLQSPIRMDHTLEHLCDVALTAQSPMALETKFRVSDHPIQQASPTLTNVRAPTKHDEKASSKRTAVQNIALNFNKRKKVSITPATSMLFFLREQYISSYVSTHTSSNLARGLSTKNNTKIATNAWR